MSLSDIIKSINQSAEDEVAILHKQNQEAISNVQVEYQKKLSEAKTKLLKQAQIAADRKVSQANFEAKFAVVNHVLKQKRDLLTEIYNIALKRLASASKSDYEKLMVKLIKQLPQLSQGEIIPAKNDEAVIKKAVDIAKSSYIFSPQTTDSLGGFIFVSEGLEINNTLENVINNLKEQTETEVTKILF